MSPYLIRTTTTKDTGTVIFFLPVPRHAFDADGQFVFLCISADQGQTQVLRGALEVLLFNSVLAN